MYNFSLAIFWVNLGMPGSYPDFIDNTFTSLSCSVGDDFREKCPRGTPADWIVMS